MPEGKVQRKHPFGLWAVRNRNRPRTKMDRERRTRTNKVRHWVLHWAPASRTLRRGGVSTDRKGTAVIDPKILDNLANRLAATLPPGIKEIRQDAEKNFRAILQGAFAKMNLVTREEFDVQRAVLERANGKIQELERQVRELEGRLQGRGAENRLGEASPGF